jgi:hypothetical protein
MIARYRDQEDSGAHLRLRAKVYRTKERQAVCSGELQALTGFLQSRIVICDSRAPGVAWSLESPIRSKVRFELPRAYSTQSQRYLR